MFSTRALTIRARIEESFVPDDQALSLRVIGIHGVNICRSMR